AGFYGAIHAGEIYPGCKIAILEKSNKLLSKVRVSGGGRCNVTHHCFDPVKLSQHYPRGEKFLRPLFKSYQAKDVVDWFARRNVGLKTEADGRMFPIGDNSETIIDWFIQEARRLNITIETKAEVVWLESRDGVFEIQTQSGKHYRAARV